MKMKLQRRHIRAHHWRSTTQNTYFDYKYIIYEYEAYLINFKGAGDNTIFEKPAKFVLEEHG